MSAKRWAGFALRLIVSAALVAWILGKVPIEKVWAEVLAASKPWLVAAFALHLVGLWISALRWGWLLRAHDAEVRTRDLVPIYLVGYFFNAFLPSGFGGDVVRAWDTRTATEGGERAAAVVLMDRASGILALFFLGALVYGVGGWSTMLPWWMGLFLVGGFVAGSTGLAMLILLGQRRSAEPAVARNQGGVVAKVLARLAGVADGIRAYRDHPRLMAEVFALGVALQLNVVLHHAFLGLALGIDIPFGFYFLMVPIVVAVMALPIAINSLGTREAAVILLFGLVGVPEDKALALSLTALGMVLVFSAAGGLVYVLRRGRPGLAAA